MGGLEIKRVKQSEKKRVGLSKKVGSERIKAEKRKKGVIRRKWVEYGENGLEEREKRWNISGGRGRE